MDKITQAELIAKICEKTGYTKSMVKSVVEATAETVKHYAKAGVAVPFPGLGTFKPMDRAAKVGRNPKTGAALSIPAKRVLAFKASSAVDLGAK